MASDKARVDASATKLVPSMKESGRVMNPLASSSFSTTVHLSQRVLRTVINKTRRVKKKKIVPKKMIYLSQR